MRPIYNPLKSLRDLRVPYKILLLLAVTLGGLVYFATQSVLSSLRSAQVAQSSASLQELSSLARQIGTLLEALQTERDTAAGYLGTQGIGDEAQEIRESLDDVRKRADQEISAFLTALDKPEVVAILPADDREDARNSLGSLLSQSREMINSNDISLSDHVTVFTHINESLFNLVAQMSKLTNDVPTSNLLAAYVNLMHMRDYMGLERGYLNNAFHAEGFQDDVLARYLEARSKREAFTDVFTNFATDAQAKMFRANSQGDMVRKSDQLADLALAQAEARTLTQDPETWWQVASGQADALQETNQKLWDELIAEVKQDASQEKVLSPSFFELLKTADELAYALQVEREYTVRYVDSKGEDYREELFEQRLKVNATLDSILVTLDPTYVPEGADANQTEESEEKTFPESSASTYSAWEEGLRATLLKTVQSIDGSIFTMRNEILMEGDVPKALTEMSHSPQELLITLDQIAAKTTSLAERLAKPEAVALATSTEEETPAEPADSEVEESETEAASPEEETSEKAEASEETEDTTEESPSAADRAAGETAAVASSEDATEEEETEASSEEPSEQERQELTPIARQMIAILQLSRAREAAGREQSFLFTSLTTGTYLGDFFERLIQADSQRETFIGSFMAMAGESQLATFDQTFEQSPLVSGAARFLENAKQAGATPRLTVNPTEWEDWMTARIQAIKSVEDRLSKEVAEKAQQLTVSASEDANFTMIVAAALVAFALAAALMITWPITSQVTAITETLDEIEKGNYTARSPVLTGDELGMIAGSLNSMADNTLSLIQSEQERDKIQASIMKLLEEVSSVADGDLTVEAEVTAEFTGAIADSFNFMIGQLREVARNVQDTTLKVNSSAVEIQSATDQLTMGSEAQATQIVDTTEAIEQVARSIQEVARNSAESAQVAEEARSNARKGTEAVHNTILGMGRIRDQVQEVAKRIKRLGESSQEIGEFTQLIGDIADRTSILALNASIQAAMAGEAGQGFAVVAEEVERLADRANDASKQIASLIHTIQTETAQAVAAMEENTREVVEGSKLAAQADAALIEIDSVSDRLAELIRSISESTKQQAMGAEELTRSMSEISQVTQQTASGTQQTALRIGELAQLSKQLRSSVSTFKLPGATTSETNGSPLESEERDSSYILIGS
ncbi:Hypothetical protein PBC10988_29280 [Planctomycetales bacterium 10988]|nr:Hypothetical protein PBC10988_29280 [Planctomycetales bacterium 10988]